VTHEEPETWAAAWEQLYRRMEQPLFNLAYRYTWRRDEAEDVVHDAFLAAWDRRAGLRLESLDRYLWVTTLNVARQRRRWRRLKVFLQIEADVWVDGLIEWQGPEGVLDAAQQRSQLARAIDALPEKLRTALLLAEFSGHSYESAAQLLEIPPGTFASRRNLALKKLRQVLNDAAPRPR
jgi:RNA polymerase sigma-70 factor (ECF subfamily)